MGRIIGENLAGAHHTFNGSLGSACFKVMDCRGRTYWTIRARDN